MPRSLFDHILWLPAQTYIYIYTYIYIHRYRHMHLTWDCGASENSIKFVQPTHSATNMEKIETCQRGIEVVLIQTSHFPPASLTGKACPPLIKTSQAESLTGKIMVLDFGAIHNFWWMFLVMSWFSVHIHRIGLALHIRMIPDG